MTKTEQQVQNLFREKLPPASISYCFNLWRSTPFHLIITKSRKTKLGDFRWKKKVPLQTITLNGDLNTYQFLITYLHEVAHLHAFVEHGHTIAPHGKEWKETFIALMHPLLRKEVFPLDILIPLSRHMRNPKASTAGDLFLARELSKYNPSDGGDSGLFLADLKLEQVFELNGRHFRKKESKRTRVVCEEISTGRHYLISQQARVRVDPKGSLPGSSAG